MEEVFLRVAHYDPDSKVDIKHLGKQTSNIGHHDSTDMDAKVDDFDLNSVRIVDKTKLFFIHFWALIMKRLRFFKRDKKGFVCEIFLPCLVVLGGLSLLTVNFIIER